MESILRFVRDERGATAIEYSLIVTGIALVIFATVGTVGTSLAPIFTKVSAGLK